MVTKKNTPKKRTREILTIAEGNKAGRAAWTAQYASDDSSVMLEALKKATKKTSFIAIKGMVLNKV